MGARPHGKYLARRVELMIPYQFGLKHMYLAGSERVKTRPRSLDVDIVLS